MKTVTHLAGPPVTLMGGINRIIQRCAVCGEKLADRDRPILSIPGNEMLTAYAQGHLVRFYPEKGEGVFVSMGAISKLRAGLPEDFCLKQVEKPLLEVGGPIR